MTTVIEIHPEELFDKLSLGSLNEQESERLRSHLATCAVCRFELAARGDFDDEFRSTLGGATPRTEVPLPLPRRSRGRLRRAVIWTSAAAALFVATGALASVVTGKTPWEFVASITSPAPVASTSHAVTPKSKAVGTAAPAVAAPATAVAPTLPVAPSAGAPDVSAPSRAAATPCVGDSCADLAPTPPLVTPSLRTPAPPLGGESPLSASALFADANRARASGDSGRAIQLYRSLQRQFPRSREAELSQLTLARLLLDNGDARSALGGFDAYLGRGGRTLQAEALVGRALSLRALGRREAEISAWRDVLERHPRSVYARQASERLSALGRL